jgi:hypothetical protein
MDTGCSACEGRPKAGHAGVIVMVIGDFGQFSPKTFVHELAKVFINKFQRPVRKTCYSLVIG